MLLTAAASHAIVTRHDVDDVKFREAAKGYDAVIELDGATGTLIDPQWILTAAHVAEGFGPFNNGVTIKGKNYKIDSVILSPDWLAKGIRGGARDLALIRLASPVKGIKPVKIYQNQDELGKTILFVGYGMTGNGQTGPTQDDQVKRGATNVVDRVATIALQFKFDAPPAGTPLEGISGPGDSGGPALLNDGKDTYILGVSSTNSGGGKDHCKYDTIETYARVSTAADWIRTSMKSPKGTWTQAWSRIHDLKNGWPDNKPASLAKRLIEALNSPGAEGWEAFNQEVRTPQSLQRTTAAVREERRQKVLQEHGTLVPSKVSVLGETKAQVYAQGSKSKKWLAVDVLLVPQNGKLQGWGMMLAGK